MVQHQQQWICAVSVRSLQRTPTHTHTHTHTLSLSLGNHTRHTKGALTWRAQTAMIMTNWTIAERERKVDPSAMIRLPSSTTDV